MFSHFMRGVTNELYETVGNFTTYILLDSLIYPTPFYAFEFSNLHPPRLPNAIYGRPHKEYRTTILCKGNKGSNRNIEVFPTTHNINAIFSI